jgi:signal transduction histidine kinase/CheY-like chemotaxis protein
MPKLKFEIRIAAAYLLLGGLWIIFSDRILQNLISDIDVLTRVQTYKGWLYVIITGLLFYLLLKSHLKKLRQAENDARESDRLKTAFLQNISHEIRTPMNGIMGFAQLLNADNLTSEQRKEYTGIINNSAKRLLTVVSDILEISQIESGKTRIYESSFDLNDLLSEVFETTKAQVDSKIGFCYSFALSNPDSIITTDYEKLKKVLYNLLDNAIKFTDNGKIEFGYTLQNNNIEFFIKDTGIGIEPENQKLIFDRFRKSDFNNNKMYDGVGLGLTICKEFLKAMGGSIWLESISGTGSTFYFNIPYKKKQTNPESLINSKQNGKKLKKILVVEDDETSFEFIKTILSKEDFTLIHAWNGNDGISLYEKHKDIDLIILDIKLPGMNGYEVLKAIRENDSHIPIIAQTAFVIGEERKIAIDSGFDEFLAKPYKKNDLLKRINLVHSKN